MTPVARVFTVCILAGMMLSGCKDIGTSNVPDSPPAVSGIVPSPASVGDTISISGSDFGAVQSQGSLMLGTCSTPVIVSWSDGMIRAIVPNVSANLAVRVTVESRTSNSVNLPVTGFVPGGVSYACDVRPILNFGCALSGCHTGSAPVSGFNQSTYAGLRAGGVNYGSNVVFPGDSSNSEIIKAMRGTATVGRMPFGGPWLSTGVPDSLIRTMALWIQQGALLN